MSRPLRIEYEGAYYHVMNRGRGKENIFHNHEHFQIFLKILEEANERFGVEIHAYCLMNNHYHLLIHTPQSNLSRAMRHINGVYTQKYNQLMQTDGPLFKGRYKAILVEHDSYLLQLSRYIHLNPIKAKLVQNLKQYQWSSYHSFIDKKTSPSWLNTDFTLSILKLSDPHNDFDNFIQSGGINNKYQEIENFYSKQRTPPILGSDEFEKRILKMQIFPEEVANFEKRQPKIISIGDIINFISKKFEVSKKEILYSKRKQRNLYRYLAIYLCYNLTQHTLKQIANHLGTTHYSNISKILKNAKLLKKTDQQFCRMIEESFNELK